MWIAFVTKFYSLIFTVVMLCSTLSFAIPGVVGTAQVSYAFENGLAGSAAGTVTVEAKVPGEYDLYWGADEDTRLTAEIGERTLLYTEFAAVTVCEGKGETQIYEFIAIPQGATNVLAYRGALLVGSAEIPEEKQAREEEALYRFGAMSDVHFNRYNLSLTGDDSRITMQRALSFFENAGVSLVGMSGDVSTKAETDSFEKFNKIASRFDFPVLTCTGNHDVGYDDKPWREDWKTYINPEVYAGAEGVSDAANDGLDFVYAPEALHGDVFVFLSQVYWDYNKETSRLLEDSQLDWLEGVLEKYKDRTVYLFFHTFLADDKGDIKLGEGNLVNNKNVFYDLVYTVGTPDEMRFRSLLQEYKNVVFFNGHSHWDFAGFEMNPRLNITDYDGTYCTMVHIPSVSSPRSVKPDAKERSERYMRSSQCYLVTVYPGRIALQGLELWGERIVAYADFNVNK